MEKIVYKLEGLDCASCAAKIEKQTKTVSGIHQVVLDFSQSKLIIESDQSDKKLLQSEIEKIVHHYEPDVKVNPFTEFKPLNQPENEETFFKKHFELIRLFTSLFIFIVAFIVEDSSPFKLPLFILAYAISGYEVIFQSVKNILNRQWFDENFLMTIASLGAMAIGEYPEAVAVMIFYEIGEYFQDLAVNRSRKSISGLMDIRPDYANVLSNDEWIRKTPDQVFIDDIIRVKPGERIPLDGTIINGSSSIDTSALTGESMPSQFSVGDSVLSGSVVINSVIDIKVTRIFAESTVARILELVENATANKAPTENFITTFAKYYTPIVVFLAVAIAVIPSFIYGFDTFSSWLYRGLIFLVISCPCALVISVPLGFFSGIGNASKNGILIKGSNYLEALNGIDTVVFDKTGTLTKGKFKVFKIHSEKDNANEILKYAYAAEEHSNHPIANSIKQAYIESNELSSENSLKFKDLSGSFEEISGKGIISYNNDQKILAGNYALLTDFNIALPVIETIGTLVYIAVDNQYIGAIEIRDEIKSDSANTIKTLQDMGKRVVMLTGDHNDVAKYVAGEIGIKEFKSNLLPEDKYKFVTDLLDQNKKVAFLGDGINDAPVLAGSTVGISMGSIGSDAAIEASDIVIMNDDPSKLPVAIKIANKTKTIVTQNIYFALGLKAVVMVLGAFGLSTMWMAIFADVGVALLAILNSMRVLAFKPE